MYTSLSLLVWSFILSEGFFAGENLDLLIEDMSMICLLIEEKDLPYKKTWKHLEKNMETFSTQKLPGLNE